MRAGRRPWLTSIAGTRIAGLVRLCLGSAKTRTRGCPRWPNGRHEIGSGLEARIGWHKTHLFGLLFVRPEVGGGWDRVVANNMGRVYGGARLGVQFIVAAYLYGHAGYGFNAPDTGFTYDVGLGVDLVLLGFLRPGVHFDYMEIVDNVQTVRGGIHVELAF